MTLFSFLVVLTFLIWLYKLLLPPRRLKTMGDKIPGPKSWPIVGNSLLYLKADHFLQTTINLCKAYGPVVRIWLGKQLMLFLDDPTDIEVFLTGTKHMNKSDSYRFLDSWLGTKSLLIGNEDIWRPHRKQLTPSFHFKILESSLGMMQRTATVTCEQLECKIDREEFDVLPYVERCSLDIICEIAMGVKLESQKSHNSPYLRSVKRMGAILMKRIFYPWLHPEIVFKYSSLGKDYYEALGVMKNVVEKVIEERKKHLTEETKNEMGDSRKQARPFLDYMLLDSNFTDEEIENEVQTFMFAGHDTTMTTVAFCLYALSQHPDVQEKAYTEIKNLLSEDKPDLTYQDYNELKYLDNVIKETLRMYTTVPLISRKVSEDITLPSGYTLPQGSLVNFILFRLHNNEKYFPNPDMFLPERFENKENIENFTFIPFSAGPRNCIGQRFATLEMKVVISALIRNYKFLPSGKMKSLTLETGIVLRSLDKHPVRITRRENA